MLAAAYRACTCTPPSEGQRPAGCRWSPACRVTRTQPPASHDLPCAAAHLVRLCSRLAEGASPAEALQELLCALLTLRHVAGVAGQGPAAQLWPTAAHAAAYATTAWLKLYGADDPPPAVWQEGGE